jgi:hypothetical protein
MDTVAAAAEAAQAAAAGPFGSSSSSSSAMMQRSQSAPPQGSVLDEELYAPGVQKSRVQVSWQFRAVAGSGCRKWLQEVAA